MMPSAGLPAAREVVSGFYESCAVLRDDTVACWGTNAYDQLGHDPSLDEDRASMTAHWQQEKERIDRIRERPPATALIPNGTLEMFFEAKPDAAVVGALHRCRHHDGTVTSSASSATMSLTRKSFGV